MSRDVLSDADRVVDVLADIHHELQSIRGAMQPATSATEQVEAKQERCMLVAFTYNELIHLMWLLGDNVGLAQTDTDWGVRRCDTSNAIMERLRASFGRAL